MTGVADYVVFEHPAGGWNVRKDTEVRKIDHHPTRAEAVDATIGLLCRGSGGDLAVLDGLGTVIEHHTVDGSTRCRRAA